MDNVSNAHPNPAPNRNDSIPLDGAPGQPHRPEATPATVAPGISRAPLNLGGTVGTPPATVAPAAPPKAPAATAPAAPKAPVVRPAPPRPAPAAAGDRITTCRTFFTKLHPGAIKFLEDQITAWLKENPSVVIKRTDVTVGEITEKKSEPSLIIVVWY
jgi:hypothetical protein